MVPSSLPCTVSYDSSVPSQELLSCKYESPPTQTKSRAGLTEDQENGGGGSCQEPPKLENLNRDIPDANVCYSSRVGPRPGGCCTISAQLHPCRHLSVWLLSL